MIKDLQKKFQLPLLSTILVDILSEHPLEGETMYGQSGARYDTGLGMCQRVKSGSNTSERFQRKVARRAEGEEQRAGNIVKIQIYC